MGSNWNVTLAREAQSVSEFEQSVAEAQAEATMTLNEVGEHARETKEAMANLELAQRRLDRAQWKQKRADELAALSPRELVDRQLER